MAGDAIQQQRDQDAAKVLPSPKRQGTALCLSGGGYRAALFHLGACRRLNELGLLKSLDVVSSVSGGSIFAAHLARQIHDNGDSCSSDYESVIAAPFRQFVKVDIRTTPALARLLPWEWANAGAGAESLAEKYREHLVGKLQLGDLPDKPRFIFCATDLAFGVNWTFSKVRVGDYLAGYMAPERASQQDLATAVATSSCFPPVFRPLPLGLQPGDLSDGYSPPGDERDACVQQIALGDGGIYDNMALEPVWKGSATVLVSDGGKPFTFAKESDTPHELYRIHDVMANQAEAVRRRWLIASYIRQDYGGAYFGIRNAVTDYPTTGVLGYSKKLAAQTIAKIRTDMDSFSDAETAVLEVHGYTLVDAAYKAHIRPGATDYPKLTPFHEEWWPVTDSGRDAFESQIAEALKDSSHVHILGH
jgi:NTE family protein